MPARVNVTVDQARREREHADRLLAQSARDPLLQVSIAALGNDDLPRAERAARARLSQQSSDVLANAIAGDIADRLRILPDAEARYRHCLALLPGFAEARLKLARVLHAQARPGEALAVLDEAVSRGEAGDGADRIRLRILTDSGRYDDATAEYEHMLARDRTSPRLVAFGNILRTTGRSADAVAAYREAIERDPACAEAWWALSNLKSGQLGPPDIARIETLLAAAATPHDQMLFHHALGKALEDARSWEDAWHHYTSANDIRATLVPFDPATQSLSVDAAMNTYSRGLFAAHRYEANGEARQLGHEAIFIVGMPRAGSTLLEQILSSHALIEGTAELPFVPGVAQRAVADRWRDTTARYPQIVERLTTAELDELGTVYLSAAATCRTSAKPFFIDKLPGNWLFAGFIKLILPGATIIDARRDAMACCFSNLKQHFARGQAFSSDQRHVASYYRDYVRFMDHLDTVAPGVVTLLEHEQLVIEPEAQVRRLLDRIGVPFDPACLRFHENRRSVRTPSSEQVRRPLSRDAFNQWRNFAPWLGELRDALGPLARE